MRSWMQFTTLVSILTLITLLVPAVNAESFLVIDFDGDEHDDNPGDGICRSGPAGEVTCNFRAAIEEANALPGTDTIEFAHNGVVTITLEDSMGPLPSITDTVIIDGTTATSYDNNAPEPEAPRPQFFIDGSELTTSGADGLHFGDGSADSIVYAIGVAGFPDEGIQTRPGADGILVQGCWIGIHADGYNWPNGHTPFDTTAGVLVQSNNNQIGQAFDGDEFLGRGNVISGNAVSGVVILFGNDNRLRGNLIGIDPNGTGRRDNIGYGVRVIDGTRNGIGGFTADANAGNVISTNRDGGIRVDTDSNFIRGNLIGTNADGLFQKSNFGNGIELFSSANVVGGARQTATNVIAASRGHGILIGSDAIASDDNIIRNNHIGLGIDGATALGNDNFGIYLKNGTANSLRDNLIGDNQSGIVIREAGEDTEIRGNLIGTNFSGDFLGNDGNGIFIQSPSNEIGGPSGARNVIGNNEFYGIRLHGTAATGNTIRRNFIGVDPSGMNPVPNASGIRVDGAPSTVISGGESPGSVIAANDGNGIVIAGTAARISGNLIGVGADGTTALGNGNHGIFLTGVEASGNLVGGGLLPGDGNIIAHNGASGVTLAADTGTQNWITLNNIFANTDMGIDLGDDGPTDNDPGDGDSGPNNLQNFPEISSFRYHAADNLVAVSYRVNTDSTNAGYPMIIAFYRADSSGKQGKELIGTDSYEESDAQAEVEAEFQPSRSMDNGDLIVTTAIDANGNTSEFSAAIPAEVVGDLIFTDRFEAQ